MPWVRFDERYREHPKVVYAGKNGRELHEAMIFYCAQNLTDGKIHLNQIAKLAAMEEVADWKGALDRLCVVIDDFENPLVDALADGFYALHDYHVYQPSKAKIMGEREIAKERMSTARAAKRAQSSQDVHPEQSPNNHRTITEASAKFARSSGNSDSVSDSGIRSPIPESDSDTELKTLVPNGTSPTIKNGVKPHRPEVAEKNIIPPTIEMVEAKLREDGHDTSIAQEFFDFYESKGWKVGREKMRDWHAAYRRALKWEKIADKLNVQDNIPDYHKSRIDVPEVKVERVLVGNMPTITFHPPDMEAIVLPALKAPDPPGHDFWNHCDDNPLWMANYPAILMAAAEKMGFERMCAAYAFTISNEWHAQGNPVPETYSADQIAYLDKTEKQLRERDQVNFPR